jgi:1,3-beta-glucan synthase
MCCKKFGTVLAAIAHGISVVMLLILWEVMFFLEGFVFAKALLGMIAAMAVQRFIYKLIIGLALTREFKNDSSNIAFWTGKWYSMGWHSFSQPAREYLCKITELGFFAGDFVLGHIILFFMLPVIAIPHVDKAHSVMLFWLRPSRQIRPPIYSMKQSKLRKRRVWRYAVLYFVMLVVFLALIVGPIVAQSEITKAAVKLTNDPKSTMYLFQPVGLNNNDTQGRNETGTGSPSYLATMTGGSSSASSSAAATGGAKMIRLF